MSIKVYNYLLKIEYDGTNFVGWQHQKNGVSIQEKIEKALQKILKSKIRIIGAGRTDKGVHALAQFSNFKVNKVMLHFEGIMGKSKIWINGILIKEHFGGYFPAHLDISKHLNFGKKLSTFELLIGLYPLCGIFPFLFILIIVDPCNLLIILAIL